MSMSKTFLYDYQILMFDKIIFDKKYYLIIDKKPADVLSPDTRLHLGLDVVEFKSKINIFPLIISLITYNILIYILTMTIFISFTRLLKVKTFGKIFLKLFACSQLMNTDIIISNINISVFINIINIKI